MSFYKLFSAYGRIGRRTFWGITLSNFVCYVVIAIVIRFVASASGNYDTKEQEDALVGFLVLLGIPAYWIGIVTSVKRFHDMNHKGWWFLIGGIPFAGFLILLGWLGIGEGTVGNNHFGPPHQGSPFINKQPNSS